MFYPSLGYNIIRNYLQAAKWPWYSRIDDVVIQGALPFRSMVDELKNKENVGGVVCCTEGESFKMNFLCEVYRMGQSYPSDIIVFSLISSLHTFLGSIFRNFRNHRAF